MAFLSASSALPAAGLAGKRPNIIFILTDDQGTLAEASPEVKNHASAHPEIVARLTRLHEDWEKRVSAETVSANTP